MKYLSLTVLFVLICSGCRQDIPAEEKAVEKVRRDFYTAISQYDYKYLRSQCTDDCMLVEQGSFWSLDSLINTLWSNEGKVSATYTFDDVKTVIDGSTAWMTYKNHCKLKLNNQESNIDFSESAIFKKEKKEWKLALLHSTRIGPM